MMNDSRKKTYQLIVIGCAALLVIAAAGIVTWMALRSLDTKGSAQHQESKKDDSPTAQAQALEKSAQTKLQSGDKKAGVADLKKAKSIYLSHDKSDEARQIDIQIDIAGRLKTPKGAQGPYEIDSTKSTKVTTAK